ncbi:hypothetical protein BGW80DRAFT_1329688, partial [Lactifluus volemus]
TVLANTLRISWLGSTLLLLFPSPHGSSISSILTFPISSSLSVVHRSPSASRKRSCTLLVKASTSTLVIVFHQEGRNFESLYLSRYRAMRWIGKLGA